MGIIDDIRAALDIRRMSQAELARAIGLDEDKMSKSINRKRRFQPDELDKIREILGIGGGPVDSETSMESIVARREFAIRLKRSRLARGWTVERAARGVIDARRLETLEKSEDEPTVLELEILSGRYAVTVDYLVTGAGEPHELSARLHERQTGREPDAPDDRQRKANESR